MRVLNFATILFCKSSIVRFFFNLRKLRCSEISTNKVRIKLSRSNELPKINNPKDSAKSEWCLLSVWQLRHFLVQKQQVIWATFSCCQVVLRQMLHFKLWFDVACITTWSNVYVTERRCCFYCFYFCCTQRLLLLVTCI